MYCIAMFNNTCPDICDLHVLSTVATMMLETGLYCMADIKCVLGNIYKRNLHVMIQFIPMYYMDA